MWILYVLIFIHSSNLSDGDISDVYPFKVFTDQATCESVAKLLTETTTADIIAVCRYEDR